MKKAWIVLNDSVIRALWKCAYCGDEAHVSPNWYQDNGTPTCSKCDNDMEYVETELYTELEAGA